MKKFSLLVLRSFIGPFILTFFIALFVLVLQFLWKYLEDLIGKGLSLFTVFELLFYISTTLVPLALPLAVLLSSIMTTGAMAENLELTAAKSSGISLLRVLRPLFFFTLFISLVAFLFANYALPVANFKMKSLLAAIQRQRPALNIQEGIFYNGIKNMVIRVEEKADDDRRFKGVLIYNHTQRFTGNAMVIAADSGNIEMIENNRYLAFTLYNGIRYDETAFYGNPQEKLNAFREKFEKQKLLIDMTDYKLDRNKGNYVRNRYSMMDIAQLQAVYKNTKKEYHKTAVNFSGFLISNYFLLSQEQTQDEKKAISARAQINFKQAKSNIKVKKLKDKKGIPPQNIEIKKKSEKDTSYAVRMHYVYKSAASHAHQMAARAKDQKNLILRNVQLMSRNRIEFYRKFSLSLACFLLFLVGAPLGAIIRKGGLGLPLICAIVIFICYYIISTISEKSVRQLAMEPYIGMWISSIVILPFGIFLIVKASTDSPLFQLDTYKIILDQLFQSKRKLK